MAVFTCICVGHVVVVTLHVKKGCLVFYLTCYVLFFLLYFETLNWRCPKKLNVNTIITFCFMYLHKSPPCAEWPKEGVSNSLVPVQNNILGRM